MRYRMMSVLVSIGLVTLSACGTSDGALREAGNSEAYIQGFHDGRHSGMAEEGNNFEHFMRDEQRFAADAEYQSGWLAGEAEGKRLQDNATMIGNVAAGAYEAVEIDKEVDKQTDFDRIAEDAVKGVDTSSLESLEKPR